jgi:phage baseplate assembly protein W
MAIRIPDKNPLDLSKRIAIGVAIPFNQPAVFRSTYSTSDQIKSNLINYILTNNNERVFNLGFGSSIRSLLFDNITESTLVNLQSTISAEIEQYFPSIRVQQLTLTPDFDNNSISMVLVYNILNGPSDTIQITL